MLWIDIEDIAEALEDKYPDVDLLTIRFTELHKWVMSLDEFQDLAERSNEKILEAIQAKWIELREEENKSIQGVS